MKKIILALFVSVIMMVVVACDVTSREPVDLILTLNPGIDTIEINTVFEDAGATANANGTSVTVHVLENTVDTTELGTYKIVYEASYRETSEKVVRIVHVIDETPPVITLNPGVDTLFIGETWVDAGAVVTDNSLEALSYTVSGEVDTLEVGQYSVFYTATDSSGNETTVERVVTIVDPEA